MGKKFKEKRAQEEKENQKRSHLYDCFLFLIQQTLPFPLLASQVQAGSAPGQPYDLVIPAGENNQGEKQSTEAPTGGTENWHTSKHGP